MNINVLDKVKTLNNNEIKLYTFKTNNTTPKNILFLGAFHGEEPQGNFLIKRFMEEIEKNKLSFKNNLFFIPCLNPDGMNLKQRGNKNNVDLNRNFPAKNYEVTTFDDGTTSGTSAASEIETQFIVKILEQYKFDVILSFHAPFEIVNFDGPAFELANKISKITNYPVQSNIGYPTPGSFGTFCGVERNIPVITLEVSEHLDKQELWQQNKDVFIYLANL